MLGSWGVLFFGNEERVDGAPFASGSWIYFVAGFPDGRNGYRLMMETEEKYLFNTGMNVPVVVSGAVSRYASKLRIQWLYR